MSSIVVAGDTSGSVTLQAPAAAGAVVVTLPSASGTMAVTGGSPSFATLTVTGDASISGLTVGKGGGAGATNTAVGFVALNANTTGTRNTALGYYALYVATSDYNTAVGYNSLLANTTGNLNTGVGDNSLVSNTTGSANSAVGQAALNNNTTGGSNTAVGRQALHSNTTASNNTAVGYQAGYSNTTSAYSTFLGWSAGYATTGGANTMLGSQAGQNATTGTYNTFVGQGAGFSVTTGAKNTILGGYNGNQGGLDIRTASNYIVLSDGDGNWSQFKNSTYGTTKISSATELLSYTSGYHEIYNTNTDNYGLAVTSSPASPYGIYINFRNATPNNTTNSFLECQDSTNLKCVIYSNGTISNRTGTYNTISDAKLKENIIDATPKLDKLMQVKVRNYNLIGDGLKQIGFVAQELEQIFPSLVEDCQDIGNSEDGTKIDLGTVTKNVKSSVFIPILVKAIQELNAKVTALEAQIAGAK